MTLGQRRLALRSPAPAGIAQTREAEQQHCPGRGLRDRVEGFADTAAIKMVPSVFICTEIAATSPKPVMRQVPATGPAHVLSNVPKKFPTMVDPAKKLNVSP